MTRRELLKALAIIPVGISLTRFTEPGHHAVVEVWSRSRLVAVKPIELSQDYQTYSYELRKDEVAAIEDWGDVSIRIVSSDEAVSVSWLELSAPAPHAAVS